MTLELLSPVGSLNQVKIAVLSGASSIYLSGKKYGARRYADNLSLEEIKESIEYAHIHNVNVYVTVNTLIREDELKECLEYLYELYCLGVDGVLIQDLGLLNLIKKHIPKLPIHASTQMKIKNKYELQWAKDNGISRVVLPRELNINELKELTKFSHEIGLEVEIFIHGAQCFSYSGECLFSSFIGGRSGNRGVCGQACRRPYNLEIVNEKGKKYYRETQDPYLLSPKDLNLYNKLSVLNDIGVDCLKIEGRMRSDEYLMTTTSTYRQAINHINKLNTPKYERPNQIANEKLNLVFNRKSSTGHLFNKKTNSIMNPERPGHYGLYIGRVLDYDNKSEISIKLVNNLNTIPERGDGIVIKGNNKKTGKKEFYGFDISGEPNFKKTKVYWNKNKLIKEKAEENTLIIKKVKENKKEKIKIEKGCEVYLSKRNKLNKTLKQLINDKDKQMFKKSVLKLRFYNDKNYPVLHGEIKLGNGKILKYKHKGEEPFQEAINKPITKSSIKKQLSKIDNQPYYIEKIDVKIMDNLFIPISEINKLRREFFNGLNELIINSYIPNNKNQKTVKENIGKYKSKTKKEEETHCENDLSVYINDLDILKKLDDKLFTRVYFEIPAKNDILNRDNKLDISYCVNQMKKAIEVSESKDFELVWMWPSIMHDTLVEDYVKVSGILNKIGYLPSIMTSELGVGRYLKKKFNITLYGSSSLNIINSESVEILDEFKLLSLSPEISKKDYENIENKDNMEVLIHGNIVSLVSLKEILSKEDLNWIKNHDNDNNHVKKLYLLDKDKNKYKLHSRIINDGWNLIHYEDYSIIKYVKYLKDEKYNKFSFDLRWKNMDYINKICEVYYNLDNDKILENCTDGNFNKGLK